MSYDAKVFNVMVASPDDVASERSIIRDVIYEWNAVHSKNRSIVLLPIGWESHSSPEMGASPQDIINQQVLDKSDLLVGVFWTRIGTTTSKYASGTVEEIERHADLGKPTMLYFSSQPAALDSVDLEQYEQIKKFKESCRNRGLYEGYDTHSEFKEKFYHHLQIKLNEHETFKDINPELEHTIVSSQVSFPSLSQEARTLLKEASIDAHGSILHVKYIGGTDIQTNGKNLINSKERRVVALWESALEELVREDLVVDQGYKGEVYSITNLGYQIADMIEL